MAVSAILYRIVRDLFERGLLPNGGALLEIGEANWLGDANPLEMVADIKKFVTEPARQGALVSRLEQIVASKEPGYQFDVVKVFYELYFAPCQMQAVDLQGTEAALRLDLNGSLKLDRRFDVVINHQTAEHVFNIAQVFKTIDQYTVPGGMMIHESPLMGWVDHGFYTLQPTLFFDVAEANQYQIASMSIEDFTGRAILRLTAREDVYELAKAKRIPDNSMLCTVLIKGAVDRPFGYPTQGYYRDALSEVGTKAWSTLR